MNCMYCGAAVNKGEQICPRCGEELHVQRRALQLSALYYNQGLDKAEIRDLSGAIDLLRRSLKYNEIFRRETFWDWSTLRRGRRWPP